MLTTPQNVHRFAISPACLPSGRSLWPWSATPPSGSPHQAESHSTGQKDDSNNERQGREPQFKPEHFRELSRRRPDQARVCTPDQNRGCLCWPEQMPLDFFGLRNAFTVQEPNPHFSHTVPFPQEPVILSLNHLGLDYFAVSHKPEACAHTAEEQYTQACTTQQIAPVVHTLLLKPGMASETQDPRTGGSRVQRQPVQVFPAPCWLRQTEREWPSLSPTHGAG